jgi:hypothetical protein
MIFIAAAAAGYGGICGEGPNSYPISSYPFLLKVAVKGITFKKLCRNGNRLPNAAFFVNKTSLTMDTVVKSYYSVRA